MKTLRNMIMAAVVVASMSTVVAVTASPAQAAVCSASRNWTYTWAATSHCAFESNWNHRAWIRCQYKEGSVTKTGYFYGPWQSTLSDSTAFCPAATQSVLSFGVEQGYFG